MNSIARIAFALLIVPLFAGCATNARQPVFSQAKIDPPILKPGDTATITVKARDYFNIIDRVEGVTREDTRIVFKLRDDGVAPDQTAFDEVWTIQVDVPFQAPPGDFTIDFTAYDLNNMAIPVKNEAGETVPLTTSLPVTIQLPQQ